MWRWRQKLGWCIYKTRSAKDCQQIIKSYESSMELILPHSPQKDKTLLTPWSQTSKLQKWDNKLLLNHPVCTIVLCYRSPSKLIYILLVFSHLCNPPPLWVWAGLCDSLIINRKQQKWWDIISDIKRLGHEWNRWGRLKGTKFQLQNKLVRGMKCTAWGI